MPLLQKHAIKLQEQLHLEALIALIEPHYPKASKKGGRPPYSLAT